METTTKGQNLCHNAKYIVFIIENRVTNPKTNIMYMPLDIIMNQCICYG